MVLGLYLIIGKERARQSRVGYDNVVTVTSLLVGPTGWREWMDQYINGKNEGQIK